MTTPWVVPPMWTGKTVAVLSAGPSLTKEAVESVKDFPCIAVNRAVRMAPSADMLVSIDGNWPEECGDFAGLRVVGVELDIDALYLNIPYEVVTLAPGNVIHIRNNALAAIRIAAMAGAAKIILLGFDTKRYEAIHNFPGLTIGLTALIAELRAQGIDVEIASGTE